MLVGRPGGQRGHGVGANAHQVAGAFGGKGGRRAENVTVFPHKCGQHGAAAVGANEGAGQHEVASIEYSSAFSHGWHVLCQSTRVLAAPRLHQALDAVLVEAVVQAAVCVEAQYHAVGAALGVQGVARHYQAVFGVHHHRAADRAAAGVQLKLQQALGAKARVGRANGREAHQGQRRFALGVRAGAHHQDAATCIDRQVVDAVVRVAEPQHQLAAAAKRRVERARIVQLHQRKVGVAGGADRGAAQQRFAARQVQDRGGAVVTVAHRDHRLEIDAAAAVFNADARTHHRKVLGAVLTVAVPGHQQAVFT